MILDDRGFIGFEEWADRMSTLLDRFGNPPTIISAAEWKRWASFVCQIPVIAGQSPPAPDNYRHWREWAQNFNQVVQI